MRVERETERVTRCVQEQRDATWIGRRGVHHRRVDNGRIVQRRDARDRRASAADQQEDDRASYRTLHAEDRTIAAVRRSSNAVLLALKGIIFLLSAIPPNAYNVDSVILALTSRSRGT